MQTHMYVSTYRYIWVCICVLMLVVRVNTHSLQTSRKNTINISSMYVFVDIFASKTLQKLGKKNLKTILPAATSFDILVVFAGIKTQNSKKIKNKRNKHSWILLVLQANILTNIHKLAKHDLELTHERCVCICVLKCMSFIDCSISQTFKECVCAKITKFLSIFPLTIHFNFTWVCIRLAHPISGNLND